MNKKEFIEELIQLGFVRHRYGNITGINRQRFVYDRKNESATVIIHGHNRVNFSTYSHLSTPTFGSGFSGHTGFSGSSLFDIGGKSRYEDTIKRIIEIGVCDKRNYSLNKILEA